MVHITEIKGSDLEGWWFTCMCDVEGALYDERVAAEMEASTHMLVESL